MSRRSYRIGVRFRKSSAALMALPSFRLPRQSLSLYAMPLLAARKRTSTEVVAAPLRRFLINYEGCSGSAPR